MATYTPFYDLDGNLVDNLSAYSHLPLEDWIDIRKQYWQLYSKTPTAKKEMEYSYEGRYGWRQKGSKGENIYSEDPVYEHYDELNRGTFRSV